jgi:hypothetical protein
MAFIDILLPGEALAAGLCTAADDIHGAIPVPFSVDGQPDTIYLRPVAAPRTRAPDVVHTWHMTGAPEGLGNRDALDAFLEHFEGAPDSSGRGLFPTFSVVGDITQARLRNSARSMYVTAGGPPQRAAYSTGEFNFGTTISLAFGAIAPPRTHFRVQVEPGTPIISIRLVAPASSQRRSVRPPISRYLLALAGSAAQGHLGPNSALPVREAQSCLGWCCLCCCLW